jgi:hypothetical protein
MLAITIIVVMLGSVFSFYVYLMRLSDTGRAHIAQTQLAATLLTQMASELRSSPGLKSHFGSVLVGKSERIEFLTAVVPSRAIFVPLQAMETSDRVEHDLRRVSYGMVRDDENDDRVIGLKRGELRVLLAPLIEETSDEEYLDLERGEREVDEDRLEQLDRAAEELSQDDEAGDSGDLGSGQSSDDEDDYEPVLRERIVSRDVRYLEFQYFNGRAWLTQWTGTVLPRAVRIVIGFSEVAAEVRREEVLKVWEDRVLTDDQYVMVVSLALSEELQARQVEETKEESSAKGSGSSGGLADQLRKAREQLGGVEGGEE